MLQSIEEYTERLKRYNYSEEEINYVIDFKENSAHLPFEQYEHLFKNNLIKRVAKLRKVRNLFFKDDKIWYLNHHHKKYEVVGEFYTEEFLKEQEAQKVQNKIDKEERKALKKQSKIKVEVKIRAKRKRITK